MLFVQSKKCSNEAKDKVPSGSKIGGPAIIGKKYGP